MTTPKKTYQHWHIEKDDQAIVWLYFDKKNASVNSNLEVLNELDTILDNLPEMAGLVVASKKTQGFIAGADLVYLSSLQNVDDMMVFIRLGQKVFDKLSAINVPTIALINGFCLGGGLELALACRYRIAEDSDKTKLGLPEVLLGIHPGWGGTARLIRVMALQPALDLLLSGRAISAKAAAKLGLVDIAVPKRHLLLAAKEYVKNPPATCSLSTINHLLHSAAVRPLIAWLTRRQLRAKASPLHYPAPYAVLRNWEQHGLEPLPLAIEHEAQSIEQLLRHPTAANLIRVFLLQDQLKASVKQADKPVGHVHVIGAGTMGGDIAAWCAFRGLTVTLQDRAAKYVAPAVKRAAALFAKKCKKPIDARLAMDRLIVDLQGDGIARADFIIEAIFENLQAKQELFQMVEKRAKPSAILATNTSSFPLDEISQIMQQPERLVGIHFFNPVAQMQLVEVVQGPKTNDASFQYAKAFVKQLDKLPLGVTSTPGFLVNRALMPYMMESLLLIDEGVPLEIIDKAAVDFGMPMGPIELADTVGLDVCLLVAEHLNAYYPMAIPDKLRDLVAKQQLGCKTGSGFYRYQKSKPIKNKLATYKNSEELADRIILRMLNELAACMREGVVTKADLADAGMIFGTGFAPFRGGPLHYAKTQGISAIQEKLRALALRHGERFTPDAGWELLLD